MQWQTNLKKVSSDRKEYKENNLEKQNFENEV